MVNKCANPQCSKPLRYLRDGRIFVFDVQSDAVGSDGKRLRHMEHYWLCGDCAPALALERHAAGVAVRPRARVHAHEPTPMPVAPAMAS